MSCLLALLTLRSLSVENPDGGDLVTIDSVQSEGHLPHTSNEASTLLAYYDRRSGYDLGKNAKLRIRVDAERVAKSLSLLRTIQQSLALGQAGQENAHIDIFREQRKQAIDISGIVRSQVCSNDGLCFRGS